jgi:nitrogen-specific signal transduction histidine kinase
MTRDEAKSIGLRQDEFDIRKSIASSITVVKMEAAKKDLELYYDIDDNVPQMLIGDEAKVEQIVTNLCKFRLIQRKRNPKAQTRSIIRKRGTLKYPLPLG